MKIFIVNWSWYPTGGDWTYIENLKKLYELNGYEVIPFSTINLKNEISGYDEYFVKSYDYKELNKNKNISNGLKVLRTSVISRDALNKIDLFFNKYSDVKIAHLHNIHHYITPAIIKKLHDRGIKIIWTLHDFKIVCPENSFISNGKLCEKCITGNFYYCALNRCKKKSFLASSLASLEAYYYHSQSTYKLVDWYLCPSAFLKKKFLQFGFNESNLIVANSCYDISIIDRYIENNSSDFLHKKYEKFVLFIGRLEEIKGVRTLIEAVIDTEIILKIVGAGMEEQGLRKLAKNYNNIEFLGYKSKEEVFELTMKASFVVCPSICYENLPFSVIESFLFSKPVVGSEIGGIPELVIDGTTGLLFEAGNAAHLCEKMNHLWRNEDIVAEMGKAAREHAYNMVNYTTHWNIIQKCLK